MAVSTVYVGTWEQIKAHEEDFQGRLLRVTVENAEQASVLSQTDRIALMLEEMTKHPIGQAYYPSRTFTLDDYYPDEEI